MMKLNFTAVLFLLLLVSPLYAQRTMKGQPFLQAAAHWGGAPGVSVSGGQYLERSLWEAGVKAQGFRAPLSTGDDLECLDITAGGTWQWRLVSTRSRALCLYAGGGLFAGYECYDPRKVLPPTIELGMPSKGVFLYGLSAAVTVEVFFCRSVALVLGADIPVNFSSRASHIRWNTTAGIRIDL